MVFSIAWILAGAALAAPHNDRDVQRQDCENGIASECTALGLRYKLGDGAPTDANYALKMFSTGCQLGDGEACVLQADAYRIGDGVARDPARAVKMYIDACTRGVGQGCRALGEVYILGDGVVRDAGGSFIWYDQGCEAGDGESCVGAAMGLERGDVTHSPSKGRLLLARSCELQHGRGCTLLGNRYLDGTDGVSKSLDVASAMFQAGCDLKDAEACYHIGMLSAKGKGMPVDLYGAKIYLTESCAGDNYNACRELADLLKGDDVIRARKAAEHGCKLGDKPSCKKAKALGWKESLQAQ